MDTAAVESNTNMVAQWSPRGDRKFLKRIDLSPTRNPFSAVGIRLAAIVVDGLPHLKVIPTWEMMRKDYQDGRYKDKHTIVIPSSGNTAHAVVRLAPDFGFKKVKVVMASDVPESKVGLLKAFGSLVDVIQVTDVQATALAEAQKEGHYLLDQYSHEGNPRAHQLYTAPAIHELFAKEELRGIAVALGSAGTVYGIATYFQNEEPFAVIGVQPKLGEQVPGARDERKMLEVVKFPWQSRIARVETVSRKLSFMSMRRLWREVDPAPGPTSGMAYAGLVQYLANIHPADRVRYGEQRKAFAFLCPDDGRFYSAPTLAELDPDQGAL